MEENNLFVSTTSFGTYTDNRTDLPIILDKDLEYTIKYFFGAFLMVTIIISTLLGNLLIIISFIRHPKLRVFSHFFVVSLALTDMLVAAGAMTFNASVHLTGRWLFGTFMCDLWNSFDVYFSSVSILHLFCISVGRYCAIMMPLKYKIIMKKRNIMCMLTFTWLVPVFISFLPIFLEWYTTEEHQNLRHKYPDTCNFNVNVVYSIVSSCISFWVPGAAILYMYFTIYNKAIGHEQQLEEQMGSSFRINRRRSKSVGDLASAAGSFHAAHEVERGDGNSTHQTKERSIFKLKRERKAARTIGIIVGAFGICWLPFFIWYLVSAICGDACSFPDSVVTIIIWFGYLNSALNPIIYAYFSNEFRHAFEETLKFVFCRFCRRSSSELDISLQRNDRVHIYPKTYEKHIKIRRRSSV